MEKKTDLLLLFLAFLGDAVVGSPALVQNAAAAEGLLKMPQLSRWRHCTREEFRTIYNNMVM